MALAVGSKVKCIDASNFDATYAMSSFLFLIKPTPFARSSPIRTHPVTAIAFRKSAIQFMSISQVVANAPSKQRAFKKLCLLCHKSACECHGQTRKPPHPGSPGLARA